MAGSSVLEGRVGTAAIVAEFQGQPGDSAFVAAILEVGNDLTRGDKSGE